jgi:hypothetical protein
VVNFIVQETAVCRWQGWDHLSWFNPTTFLRLSLARNWISNVIWPCLFVFSMFRWEEIVRLVDFGGIADHYCLNFLFIKSMIGMPQITDKFHHTKFYRILLNTDFVIKFVSDLRQVCGFSPCTPVSSTNWKWRLNTIKPNQPTWLEWSKLPNLCGVIHWLNRWIYIILPYDRDNDSP